VYYVLSIDPGGQAQEISILVSGHNFPIQLNSENPSQDTQKSCMVSRMHAKFASYIRWEAVHADGKCKTPTMIMSA